MVIFFQLRATPANTAYNAMVAVVLNHRPQ